MQTYGDKAGADSANNGITVGATGKSKRLEAIRMRLPEGTDGSIEYRSHLQGIGWESAWAADGEQSGTIGQSRRIEAVQMRLTGAVAESHSVWYRVHSQTYGWLGWAHDGASAGTTGRSKCAEAVELQILPKGQVPAGYDASKPACINDAR